MLCIIEKKSLVSALKGAARIVERRNSVEICSGVRIDTQGEQLRFTTTDLDIYSSVMAAADIGDNAPCCVPAHTFAKMAANLPDGPVTLETENREAGEYLVVTAGAARFELSTRDAKDFPEPAENVRGEFQVPAAVLRRLLEKTRYAISTEEVRFYLNGTFLDADTRSGRLIAVAVDGHRLATAESPLPDGAGYLAKFREQSRISSIIVPRKTCLELLKAFARVEGDITVSCVTEAKTWDSPRLAFTAGPVRIISKLIDGSFPDWRRVIPSADAGHTMRAKRADLEAGIAHVSALSADKTRAIKFTLNGKLVLSAVNPETGETREEIAADWTGPHDAYFEIGFNGRYLADLVDHVEGEEIEFRISDPGSPARIIGLADPDALHVLMPMRV